MDWENERYVRVYVRDTPDLLAAGWDGRAVLWELMRKSDRAGIVPFDGDIDMLAELIRMPSEVVSSGLAKLIRRNVLHRGPDSLVLRNFMEAQEARQSDRQRQKESRARRRVSALSQAVTAGHGTSQPVTIRDTESQSVTECHDLSQRVTGCHPSLAEPSLAEPDPPISPPGDAGPVAQLSLVAHGNDEHAPERSRIAQERRDGHVRYSGTHLQYDADSRASESAAPAELPARRALTERAANEGYARELVAWLNGKRRELTPGIQGHGFSPLAADALKAAARLRKAKVPIAEAIAALELRLASYRRIGPDAARNNLTPATMLNTKLAGFVEQIRAGHSYQVSPARTSKPDEPVRKLKLITEFD